MKNFSNRPSVCVGATLVVFGCLAIAAEIVRKNFISRAQCDEFCMEYTLWNFSAGIWCGAAFVFFGVCAIISGKLQRKCLVCFHGFLSIATIGFAFALITISGANVVMSFSYTHPYIEPPYTRVYYPCWNYNNNYEQNTPYQWRPWYQNPTTPDYWRQWYGYRTTPDYWRQWYGDRSTPNYWDQWYRSTPNYWNQWYREQTTEDNGRQWYGDRSTPSYWRPWYRDRSTTDWRSWLWGGGQSTTTRHPWMRWFFNDTAPKSYWRGDGPREVTTSVDVTTVGRVSTEGRDINDDDDRFYYFEDESFDPSDRRKRQSMTSDCWTLEIHVPFLVQLIMSCLLIGIGVLVAILSVVTATTACIPFCCPPRNLSAIYRDVEVGRQVPFHDGPMSHPVFDVVSRVPKPETETREPISNQSAAAEIVTAIVADDVPLLMDDSDSRILHV